MPCRMLLNVSWISLLGLLYCQDRMNCCDDISCVSGYFGNPGCGGRALASRMNLTLSGFAIVLANRSTLPACLVPASYCTFLYCTLTYGSTNRSTNTNWLYSPIYACLILRISILHFNLLCLYTWCYQAVLSCLDSLLMRILGTLLFVFFLANFWSTYIWVTILVKKKRKERTLNGTILPSGFCNASLMTACLSAST